MLSLSLMVLNLAYAANHTIGLSVDGHASVGLHTRLPVTGIGGSIQLLRRGDGPHGLMIEAQNLMEWSPSGLSNLPGGRLGWYRQGRTLNSGTEFYSLLGLGGYANDVLPVLPMVWGEVGIQRQLGRTQLRVGPELMALPPFFVGSGFRVSLMGWEAE